MEIELKEVRKWGNSGGVLLPREWIGKQIKVLLVDRTLDIKREVLKILEPYLEDIIGIYLVGSYARKEQTKDSDIDILAISHKTKKSFSSGKYEIEIIPLKDLTNLLGSYPIVIYPKIADAIPILNKSLLDELKKVKVEELLAPYIENCKKMLAVDKKLLRSDKERGDVLRSYSVIYSSLLRLKALYIAGCLIKKKRYSNKDFNKYLISNLEIDENEMEKLYGIYRSVLRKKKIKTSVSISVTENLVSLLEKEIGKHDKKKKET